IDGDPEEGGTVFTLLEGVKDIEFEYWRPDREIAGDAWEPQWDTRDNGVSSLPSRVRITVELENPLGGREDWRYVIEAQVHLRQPIGFVTESLAWEDIQIPGDEDGDGIPDEDQQQNDDGGDDVDRVIE
ncbi:MAG: hypothetical protein KC561_09825, partial [Myxococcales bacterium]|nr:hypothetical protein [Myxococcales bacterium]